MLSWSQKKSSDPLADALQQCTPDRGTTDKDPKKASGVSPGATACSLIRIVAVRRGEASEHGF
jgi:hypothetical protein